MKRSFLLCGTIAAMIASSHGAIALEQHEIPPGATAEVSEQSVCRKVTNNGTGKIMVPVRSAQEWAVGGGAFLNNLMDMDDVGIEKCDGYQDDYCFLWASGLFAFPDDDWAAGHTKIGGSTVTWTTANGKAAGTDMIGVGSFADSYGSDTSPGPIYLSSNGTLDSIAVGRDAVVTFYTGKNFTGTAVQVVGPKVLMNDSISSIWGMSESIEGTGGIPWTEADWSTYGPLISQFTPETRGWATFSGLQSSNALFDLEHGSFRVTCK